MIFLIGYRPFGSIISNVPDVRLRPFVTFGAIATACVAVSTLTYWVIERPFLLRKAKL